MRIENKLPLLSRLFTIFDWQLSRPMNGARKKQETTGKHQFTESDGKNKSRNRRKSDRMQKIE
jgi:hypothetical protein